MYTNTMRFTGLSGIDTESMIKQLMKAESAKMDKLKQQNQLLVWRQEAYRAQATALQTFQRTYLYYSATSTTNMRSPETFTALASSVTSSGTGTITARASTNTVAGTYSVKVQQTAQADRYVGITKFNDSIETPDSFQLANVLPGDKINVTLDGVTKTITLTGGYADKPAFLADLNAKLGAAFGVEQKINAQGNPVTDSNNLPVMVNKLSAKFSNGQLKFVTNTNHTFRVADVPRDTSFASSGEFTLNVSNLSNPVLTVDGNAVTLDNFRADMSKAEFINALNAKVKPMGLSFSVSTADNKDTLTVRNTSGSSVTLGGALINMAGSSSFVGGNGTPNPTVTLSAQGTLSQAGLTQSTGNNIDLSKPLSSVFNDSVFTNGVAKFTIGGHTFTANKTDTISSLLNQVNTADDINVKMSYDSFDGKFILEGTLTGNANAFSFNDEGTSTLLSAMGLTSPGDTRQSTAQDAVMTYTNASNHTFTINRQTNVFTVDNIDFNIGAAKPGDTYTISFTADTSKALDSIKKFVEDYNKVVDQINKEVFSPRPSQSTKTTARYEPLTDEQKKAMSEKEVELWEAKAKTGMLYRDDILGGLLSQMRAVLYNPVKLEDGTEISLHQIGITTTSSVKDAGKLIIDEAKLTKALEERPNDVATLFTKTSQYSVYDKPNAALRMKEQGISERLNDLITAAAIGSNSAIGLKAGLVGTASETDNQLFRSIKDSATKIDDMLSYLIKRENYYYGYFARMEAAINKANQQAAYVSQMFGGGGGQQ